MHRVSSWCVFVPEVEVLGLALMTTGHVAGGLFLSLELDASIFGRSGSTDQNLSVCNFVSLWELELLCWNLPLWLLGS